MSVNFLIQAILQNCLTAQGHRPQYECVGLYFVTISHLAKFSVFKIQWFTSYGRKKLNAKFINLLSSERYYHTKVKDPRISNIYLAQFRSSQWPFVSLKYAIHEGNFPTISYKRGHFLQNFVEGIKKYSHVIYTGLSVFLFQNPN
jgi:hypothetical protein